MEREPTLQIRAGNTPVRAAALVLHGGRSMGTGSVPPWAVAYLRMRPFANALHRAGGSKGLAVASLRHVVRGWNGDQRSPVVDAYWALDRLRERFGDIEVGLVGHSMGGRTALAVADHPSVRSVVALAPWIEPQDGIESLTGRTVLIVHGTLDRMTDPRASATFAERARAVAKQVTYVAVPGEKHAMLRRPRFWHELAAGFTTEVLLPTAPNGTVDTKITNVIREALAGTPVITV
jgi:dipeptidyl aminopeptidase/acylaminoacyl peptidase